MKDQKCILLFDFDGTVIDTMSLYADLAAEIVSKYTDISYDIVRKKYLESAGRPFIDQLGLIGVEDDKREFLYSLFVREKEKILYKASLDNEALKLLRNLRERGYFIALTTNNECELVRKVRGIKEFHLILCFDGKKHRKGKEHLESLRKILGDNLKHKVFFIGDSLYDMKIYGELGIKTIYTKGIFEEAERLRIMKQINEYCEKT